MDCPFCPDKVSSKIIEEYGAVFAVEDNYPVAKGHLLIIPRRHTTDFFSMTPDEAKDAEYLLRQFRERLLHQDATITGFNIGINCSISAGQTIMHAHIHLIPRYFGDVKDSEGGIRNIIPGMGKYH